MYDSHSMFYPNNILKCFSPDERTLILTDLFSHIKQRASFSRSASYLFSTLPTIDGVPKEN